MSKVSQINFLQSTATTDIFSLGVILLQITTGSPAQLQLPLRFKCLTTEGDSFIDVPFFGSYQDPNTEQSVRQIIKLQEKILRNLDHFSKKNDRMKLYQNEDFKDLLQKLLAVEHCHRLSCGEVINHSFIKKNHLLQTSKK